MAWPDGISIKVYKHKALGVFAYSKDKEQCQALLKTDPVPCKFWRDSYYVSHMGNLDQERYVLLEGNEMSKQEALECLEKVKVHLDEVTSILSI